jgi:MFS transporter, SP family, major inositol transporter
MTENDLICEKDYRIGLLGSVVFFGFMLSSITIMPTPDIFGRKPVLLITGFISTSMAALILFLNDLNSMYIALFFYGFTVLVRGTTSYVYLIEIVPPHLEKKIVMILSILEKIQVTFIPIWFYMFRDWRYQIALFVIASFGGLIYLIWVPESPKFLNQEQETEDSESNKEYSDK